MGRKAKRGAKTTKGDRDGEKAAPPADDDRDSSSDGEGGRGADTAGTGLPMANVVRLIRQVIPKGFKVSTRAKHLTHDCTVEFIGFVAGEASEQAMAQHRRTIAPDDFIHAFEALGFDDYVQPMSTYIRRYHEHHINNNNAARGYRGSSFVQVPRPHAPSPHVAAAAEEPAAAVTAPGVPRFSGEEMQYMRSMVPPLLPGEQDDEGTSSAGHGYGYTRYM